VRDSPDGLHGLRRWNTFFVDGTCISFHRVLAEEVIFRPHSLSDLVSGKEPNRMLTDTHPRRHNMCLLSARAFGSSVPRGTQREGEVTDDTSGAL